MPASLTALQLWCAAPIDLGELAQGGKRLSAAAAPVLSVRSARICCRLEWTTGGPEHRVASDAATAVSAGRLVSRLAPGFVALDMFAYSMTISCSSTVQEPTPAAAARELCLFFAHAPPSYRRFSLCWVDENMVDVDDDSVDEYWEDDRRLRVHLFWPRGSAEPGSTASAGEGEVAFDGVEELAENMHSCAVAHGMTVAVIETPTKHVVVTRL